MITITVYDSVNGTEKRISENNLRLANSPLARVQFCTDYNRVIAGFINKVLGKDKKSMKDLDKEK